MLLGCGVGAEPDAEPEPEAGAGAGVLRKFPPPEPPLLPLAPALGDGDGFVGDGFLPGLGPDLGVGMVGSVAETWKRLLVGAADGPGLTGVQG